MWRPAIRNHAFEWMGERFAPLFDPDHFLGHHAFTFPYKKLKPVNVRKNDDRFGMEVAVPGFSKDELSVRIESDVLCIEGVKESTPPVSDLKYITEQFEVQSFTRRFRLAKGIDKEKITARYNDGVLYVTLCGLPEMEKQPDQQIKVS